MEPIPAASIEGVNLSAIFEKNPAAAEVIAMISAKMNTGDETDQEFIRLCDLLCQFGFAEVAKGLLIANSNGEDQAFNVLINLFPDCKITYDAAMDAFRSQYEVSLVLDHQERAFCSVYSFDSESFPRIVNDANRVKTTQFEVQFTLEPDGIVVADAYTTDNSWAVPLKFGDAEWSVDDQ